MCCRYCGRPLKEGLKDWCDQRCKARFEFNVPSVKFKCPECKLELRVPKKPFNRKFCSGSCARAAYNRKHFRGPNNPRWRGGRVLSYGPGWKEIKERVRGRDKNCRRCGKTPEENGRKLDVHHLGPYRFTGDNDLENLEGLCRSCHMRSEDWGRRGSAKFAGPQQLELRPLSQRELQRQRGAQIRARRKHLQSQAFELNAKGLSLRQIGRALGVSHQTVANWLSEASD